MGTAASLHAYIIALSATKRWRNDGGGQEFLHFLHKSSLCLSSVFCLLAPPPFFYPFLLRAPPTHTKHTLCLHCMFASFFSL